MAERLFGAGLISIRERAYEREGLLAASPVADCGGCGGCGPMDVRGDWPEIDASLLSREEVAPTSAQPL
jgi:hypothetical protein